MTKAQLIEAIARRSGLSKLDSLRSIEAFIEIATETLRNGEKITMPGFGSFEVVRKPARVGRNFLTGTPVDIPPRSAVKFRCSVLDKL